MSYLKQLTDVTAAVMFDLGDKGELTFSLSLDEMKAIIRASLQQAYDQGKLDGARSVLTDESLP
jgi:hypothetical protein